MLLGAFAFFPLACGLRSHANRRKWKAQQITRSVWSCEMDGDVTKLPSHVPESNIVEPSQQSFQTLVLFLLVPGIRGIMCHEVAGEQQEAAVHTEHAATISDSVVAGHCVSPMSCAMIRYSFPESLETCTSRNSICNVPS